MATAKKLTKKPTKKKTPKKFCGAITKQGTRCKIRVAKSGHCRVHNNIKSNKKPRKLTVKQEKFVEGILKGKSGAEAAREAGYSKKTARLSAHKNITKYNIQEKIQERINEAKIETNEIIGTLVSQMRGDLTDLIDETTDPYIQFLKQSGKSHLIKKLKIKETVINQLVTERTYEFEIHDSQSAAKTLANIFGLEKLPAPNPQAKAKAAFEKLKEQFGDKMEESAIALRVSETFNVPVDILIESDGIN